MKKQINFLLYLMLLVNLSCIAQAITEIPGQARIENYPAGSTDALLLAKESNGNVVTIGKTATQLGAEYTLTPLTANQFSITKNGTAVQTIDLTSYVNENVIKLATFDSITKNLNFTLTDNSAIVVDLSSLITAGTKGDKGDAFVYSDFTPAQITALKGATGATGSVGGIGPKGEPFIYSDFTTTQLAALKGAAFTYSDFTAPQLALLKGAVGDKGDTGDKGDKGDTGATGIAGSDASATTDAAALATGTLNVARLPSTVTVQGNTFNGNSQLVKTDATGKIPSSTYIQGSGGTGTSTFINSIVATSVSDLTSAANANKIIIVQTNLTLTANTTLASNITLYDGGGSINLNAFTLTGNNTGIVFFNNKKFLDAIKAESKIAGSWNLPQEFSITNLGAVADGIDHIIQDESKTIGTGSINTTNLTTLTVPDADFTGRQGQQIAITNANSTKDRKGLKTTIAAVISPTQVTLANPAVRGTTNPLPLTNMRVFYGTDNKWAIQTAIALRNKKSGKLVFPEGHYMTEVEQPQEFDRQEPVSWVVGNGTDGITYEMTGAIIQSFPINFVKVQLKRKAYMFYLYNTDKFTWNGGTLIGEYFTAQEQTEYPAGYNISSGVTNAVLNNVTVTEFHGDGAIATGDAQISGIITGSSFTNTKDSGTERGLLDSSTGLITASTTWASSASSVSVSSGIWDRQYDMFGFRQITVGNASFQGWAGLTRDYYYAYFYDAADNFLFRSPRLYLYDKYTLREDVKRVKFSFPDVKDISTIELNVFPDLAAQNVTFNNCHWTFNGRQGFSNPPQYMVTFRGGTVMNNGDISPGAGFDFEDKRRLSRHVLIDGMTFQNNYVGDIIFIGTQDVKIVNCTFLEKDRVGWGGTLGIRSELGRDVIISNNVFNNSGVSLGRNDVFTNNKMRNTFITTSGEASTVSNNDLYNTNIKVYALTSGGRTPDVIKDNILRIDRPISYIFSDQFLGAEWIDNKIYINDISRLSNLAEVVDTNVGFNSTFGFSEDIGLNNSGNLGGFIDGLEINIKDKTEISNNPDNYNRPALTKKFQNIYSDAGVYFIKGIEEDKYIDNINYPFAFFRNDGFRQTIPVDSIANPAKTIYVKNSKFEINSSELNWGANTNSTQIQTSKQFTNFVFDNSKFIINGSYTPQQSSRSNYIKLNHLGTTVFKNCYFKNDGATAVGDNLDTSNYWIGSNGPSTITFENCDFASDVLIPKLRTGDIFIDTRKPYYLTTSTNIRMSSPGGTIYTGVNTAINYQAIGIRNSGKAQVRFNTTEIPNITGGVDNKGNTVTVTIVNPDIFVPNTLMDMALENENGKIYVYLLKR